MGEESRKHPLLLYVAAFVFAGFVAVRRINVYFARRRMKKENGCEPCPHIYNKDPILGLDAMRESMQHHEQRDLLDNCMDRFKKMNVTTYRTRLLTMPVIVTTEPENIKTILSLKFKDYSLGQRTHSFGPLLGEGIFNSTGERWANSRHLLRPNFAREQVADLDVLEDHLGLLIKALPQDGSTVDLQELFFRLTIDTATQFLFNHSTSSLKTVGQDETNNEDAIFAKAFNDAQADILVRGRLGFLNALRKNKDGKEAIQICHAYIDKWVDEAIQYRELQEAAIASGKQMKEKSQERYIFIHELAKQTKDKKRLREELINILLAGRDTTASLLSNMFFEIAKQPEIWKKLRAEIGILEGRRPTYEELRGFKYLKWCLNESLRIHPVVPVNSRLAIRDTVLPVGGGPSGASPLFVPRGTMVGYNPYVMHRRQDFYGSDSHTYRPERWETLRPGWEYLPFNGGPRICLGQQYALTEASYVTVRLVQLFKRLESRDEGPWVEGLTLTVCSANGTKVGLMPE